MSATVVDAVRSKTDPQCHETRCRDGRCGLSMENAPAPRVLVYLENSAAPVDPTRPHCDYLFIGGSDSGNGPWVAPIELTASAARVSKFLPQLRAGAEIADRLIPSGAKVMFRPIAAYGGELRRIERDNFLKSANHVRFRGKTTPVKLVRCGSPLNKALSS